MRHPIFLTTLFILLTAFPCQAQQDESELPLANGDTLSLPEGMQQHEIDSLLYEWNVRKFLSFDDSCQTSDENPTFTSDNHYMVDLCKI